MIKKKLFEKTVNILVNAYFNDTLEHRNTCGCAVGNLVAANMGYEYVKKEKTPFRSTTLFFKGYENTYCQPWARAFATNESEEDDVDSVEIDEVYFKQEFKKEELLSYDVKQQINSTGYTARQLAKIEWAFETASKGKSADDWMYNGLMAVVEVLQQIHKCSKEETNIAKERFKKEDLISAVSQ